MAVTAPAQRRMQGARHASRHAARRGSRRSMACQSAQSCKLLRLQVHFPDHRPPPLDFRRLQCREGRRGLLIAGGNLLAQIRRPTLNNRYCQGVDHGRVELWAPAWAMAEKVVTANQEEAFCA
jgi:hypothetical protein